MSHNVIRQNWEESEADWGAKPDGYSLHKSPSDLDAFIHDYWQSMPDQVPTEYSRPSLSHARIVEVDDDTYQRIIDSPHGIRVY